MKISREKLAAEAEATGFRSDVLERVAHLLGLLDAIRSHPFLKGKLALKGGTALNLFVFDVPRLSVDIDLNYMGAEDRQAMLAERPKIEQALRAVFARESVPCSNRDARSLLRTSRFASNSLFSKPRDLAQDCVPEIGCCGCCSVGCGPGGGRP